jgi:hypothetical protein
VEGGLDIHGDLRSEWDSDEKVGHVEDVIRVLGKRRVWELKS